MTHKPISLLLKYSLLSFALMALSLLLFSCSNGNGSSGTNGTSFGTVTGTVTDTFNNRVANATVTPSPAVDNLPGNSVSTALDGSFSMTIPNGTYTLTFANPAYASQTLSVSVVATQTTKNVNVTLVPIAAAAVTVAGPAAFPAAGSVTLTATPVLLDPALAGKAQTFQWTDQLGNVLGAAASLTVNKPTGTAFKANVAGMVAPLFSIEPAPTTVTAEGEEVEHKDIRNFVTLDRLMVVGIPLKAYEDAANPTYTVAVTINGQKFTQTVKVGAGTADLPFVANPGLRNVPIGQPILLQGPDGSATNSNGIQLRPTQTTWNFTLAKPAGSAATLIDNTTRFPHFVPDVVGTYTVTETVSNSLPAPLTVPPLTIYAGKWVGVLIPAADTSDNPLGDVDAGCTTLSCHAAATLTKFTDWRNSGHSKIMVKGMVEGSQYTLANCGKCHSVGGTYLGSDTSAGGFRDVAVAAGFTDATFLGKLVLSLDPAVSQMSKFFKGFDRVLKLSEVQCENCHGPNSNGDVHPPLTADAVDARVSFSADVCAPCHGEPTRYGRFQEWRESGHGDFETAIHEGITGIATATPFGTGPNSGCAGCHTGQAFPLLVAQLEGGNPLRTLTAASLADPKIVNLRTNNVQPQTCVTCHTSHNAGSLGGLVGNIVNLRGDYQSGGAFDGITPLLPAGFQANGVGRGALCITCHNSRNGGVGTFGDAAKPAAATLHEDKDPNFGTVWTSTAAAVAYSAANILNGTYVTSFTSYSGPHDAAQGDVLMGRNAYFFNSGQIGQRSKHSLLADACVTCHMEKAPPDPTFGVSPTSSGAGTNHSFGIVTDPAKPVDVQINALCAQCHNNFDGTGVQKTFTAAYNTLLTELATRSYMVKTGHTPVQDGFSVDTDVTRTPAAGDLKVTFIPGRAPQIVVNGAIFNLGRATIDSTTGSPTFNTVTTPGWLTTVVLGVNPSAAVFTGITTQAGTATPASDVNFPKGTILNNQGMEPTLARANWNAELVALDSSQGVHNPSFTMDVINVAINHLRLIQ